MQEALTKLNVTTVSPAENEQDHTFGLGSVMPPHNATQSRASPSITTEDPMPTANVFSPQSSATIYQNLTKGPQTVKSAVTVNPSAQLTDMNPPEIQKVVVEHIVRSEEVPQSYYAGARLRSFSGRLPRPNNEADYETWRSSVALLLTDPK